MSSKVCMILVWFFVICLLVVGLVMVSSTAAWAEETKHPYEPPVQADRLCLRRAGGGHDSLPDRLPDMEEVYLVDPWRGLFLLVLCYVPGIGKEINGNAAGSPSACSSSPANAPSSA